jgi:hypothetical protein
VYQEPLVIFDRRTRAKFIRLHGYVKQLHIGLVRKKSSWANSLLCLHIKKQAQKQIVTVSSRPYLFPLSVGSPTSPHPPQTDHGTTSYDTRQPLFPRHCHITLLWFPSLLRSALGLTSSHVVHPHGYYASSQGIT